MLTWPRSMDDWEPPDMEDPSEEDKGGVSMPELEVVQVLERERVVVASGLEKTGMLLTVNHVRLASKSK
jgi:hypothetical protein